jgi:hypothetical protein
MILLRNETRLRAGSPLNEIHSKNRLSNFLAFGMNVLTVKAGYGKGEM